ncbi:hypothetical protein FPCIR_14059 [Fusarium pseudocircinatum]|uniref:Uncharacterized protein n=1 Tax=Fusarium pseudocircinatum TaxID=56676 RepID=A0A8H5KH08_9HYPO|nr:hypothetical protein FPCIR_14059 [Fusarium pseudocircinatum]
MRAQAIGLLSVATLVPSIVGVAVPRAPSEPNQPNLRRFPLNETAIATAPDGSTTRLSSVASTPITQVEEELSSLPDKPTSTKVYSSTAAETSSGDSVQKVPITSQLDRVATSSQSTRFTLETHLRSFSEPSASHFIQTVPKSAALSNGDPSDHDRDSSSVTNQPDIQASAQRRPHQGFAHSFTQAAPNNTKLKTQTCGPGYRSPCGWIPSVTSRGNGTYTPGPWTSGTLTLIAPTSVLPCTTLQDNEPFTEYSIVYTSTITFSGNRSDYTPPYPTISTPNICDPEAPSPSFSKIVPSHGSEESGASPLPGSELTMEPPQACLPGKSCTSEKPPGWLNPTAVPGVPGLTMSSSRTTVTFITTDKNPAVVFPTEPPPHFDRPTGVGGLPMSNKQLPQPSKAPGSNHPNSSARHGKSSPQSGPQPDVKPRPSAESGPRPMSGPQPKTEPQGGSQPQSHSDTEPEPPRKFLVTARGQEVIVNDRTFSSLRADQTTTVTVDYGTFTIRPTEVVGEGATVRKPQPVGTVISVVSPTSATIGKIYVTVSGTEAIVGGTRLKIPPMGTTTRLKVPVVGSNTIMEERQVSIAPGRVAVDDETLTYHGVGGPQTDVIIEGGEMVTAVGKSVFVFHSTTLIYGTGTPVTTETIDDDTITVGPEGIVVDGTTLGGSDAELTSTKYRIVGGATITKVNPSYAIIDETTFTAGPGAKSTTKVAGGETITIGPSGIIIGTITVKYPFGASTVTTIEAKATASDELPVATGTSNNNAKEDGKRKKEDDSGAILQRPGLATGMAGLCIAFGVWILF